MVLLCVDESGSLCPKGEAKKNYFVICLVRIKEKNRLQKEFKRFISSNMKQLSLLKKSDKMFINGKFAELKGCALPPDFKKKTALYLCQNDLFDVSYIIIRNWACSDNIFQSKSRSFNFFIEQFLSYAITKGYLPKDEEYVLNIDNRNTKVEALLSLGDYLWSSLVLEEHLVKNISVSYYDSTENHLIQVADFFSNLLYSELLTKNYDELLNKLIAGHYINFIYKFPLHGC